MRPFCAQIYCTTKCDNHCSHCTVRSSTPGDADFDNVARNLTDLARLGVPYVDLTGGNPLSWEALPEALRHSNDLGIYTSLTVSGPLITKRGPESIRLPDMFRVSLDGLEVYHDKNRGPGYFGHAVAGIEMAKELRQGKATQIVFTVMPGPAGNINPETLNGILTLARKMGVLVNVNPVFGAELNQEEISHLLWFARQSGIQVSRGRIRFLTHGGNNTKNPTCRAASSVITISADNYLVLPCYHNPVATVPLDKMRLELALDSPARKWLEKQQGKLPACQGCSIWCYIIPSWIELAPFRLVAWLHALSGLQEIRDGILRFAGKFRSDDSSYPNFPARG